MQLFQYTIIAVLGLGLAAAVALVYVVLRYSAWTPAGGTPAASARMHGMVTALIALFATGTAGLERLARPEHSGGMNDGHLREVGTYVHEYPLLPLSWPDALIAVASPGVWLFLIYLVAQYSWPRPTAQVRTVRLADRSTVSYLPRTLTLTTAAVMLAAVIATALAWTVSESPARTHEEVLSSDDITHQMSMIYVAGLRGGHEFAPWLLLGLVLLALATAAAIRVITRRPTLSGLTTEEDDATRHIAVNRALRTAAVASWGFFNTAINAWFFSRAEASAPVSDVITVGVGVLGFVLLLSMLLWRSPSVFVLRQDRGAGSGGSHQGAQPTAPGTPGGVLRLRQSVQAVVLVLLFLVVLVLAPALAAWTAWTDGSGSEGRSPLPVWGIAIPVVLSLALLCVAEFAVLRGHAPNAGAEHSNTVGRASRWRWIAFLLSALLLGVWLVLTRTVGRYRPEIPPILLVSAAVIVALTLGGVLLSLRRPALGSADTAEDRVIRTAGADRILGVGTGGLLLPLALTSAMATPTWAALIQPGTHYRIGAPTEAVIYASLGSFVALAVAALLMFTWPVPRPRPAHNLPESAGRLAHGVRS